MKFIVSSDEFNAESTRLGQVINLNAKLPGQIFKKNFSGYLFCEFDFILKIEFVKEIVRLLKVCKQTRATFISIEPKAREYFNFHFGYYGAFKITSDASSIGYANILNFAPGENVVETLIHHVFEFAIISEDSEWCIYGDRKTEMAIFAYSEKITQEALDFNQNAFPFLHVTAARGSEIIIAIAVLGILATLVTPIFQTWIQSSSSKTCVRNQALIQENMRGYAGLNNLATNAALVNTTFIGNTGLMASPTCGGGGTYTYGTVVPAVSVAYASCNITTPVTHAPPNTSGW